MKKLFSFLKRPIVAIIALSIAFLCIVVSLLLPDYPYSQSNGVIQFTTPKSFCSSDAGWNAIADAGNSIYCMNENNSLMYAINITDFPCENAEIIDITFGADNKLYCHVAVYNEDAYLTDSESIYEIGSDGKITHELIHYDYTDYDNQPSYQVMIKGLHFYDGMLRFIYKASDNITLMAIDSDNPQENFQTVVEDNTYSEIIQCNGTSDGNYIALKNNGEICSISYDGELESIYKFSYDSRNNTSVFPIDVFMHNGEIYLLAEKEELIIYKFDNKDNWNRLAFINKHTQTSDSVGLFSYNMGEMNNVLTINVNEFLYTLDDNADVQLYDMNTTLPVSIILAMSLKSILPVIGIICLIIGLPLGIGNIMKWRFTVLSKQLISTIPIVFAMLTIVIIIMFSSMTSLSTEDILRETIAINEIAAARFSDDEDISSITGYDSVDNGHAQKLSNELRTFINGNKSQWSRKYNMALYVRTIGEEFVCVATSDGSGMFMNNRISTVEPIDRNFYENTNTFAADVGFGEDAKNLQLVLLTPIYQQDGSYDAIVLLNASQSNLTEEIISAGKSLLITVALWVILLIIVITAVSAVNTNSLRQAQNVVSVIAGGDFSKRVEKYSRDEVGEICAGVNNMAARLEEFFEERIRNEQFYYKFVPEKFRELLYKENFTDLELGDAQSKDLSILFCDIRAYSLNSEMMTAKESFDFINKIYGKGGPIIREHNGFIDKYIGDAIMALFESADDAVAAGIELYKAIALNPNPQEDFGLSSVKIGIGIHSGMSRIGIVGEEERMSGTVISNTVNISSRIESLTKRYGAGMIISKDTLDRMKHQDTLSTRYLGMVQVAGVNEISALYEVLNCLTDEQRAPKEETKLEFREAVRTYHSGNPEQSVEIFRRIHAKNPADPAPQLYISYLDDVIMRGGTEHNVFQFKNK